MKAFLCLALSLSVLGLGAVASAQVCPNPTPLACSDLLNGDSSQGINRINTSSCFGYSLAGMESYYLLSLPQASPVHIVLTPTTAWDPALLVFPQSAWDCATTACAAAADNGLDGDPEVVDAVLPAGNYYVVVDGYGSTGQGPHTIELLCQECSMETCGDSIDQDCDGSDIACPALAADASITCPQSPLAIDTATQGHANIDDYAGLGAANGFDWSANEYLLRFAPTVPTAYTVATDHLDLFLLLAFAPGVPNPDALLTFAGETFVPYGYPQSITFLVQANEEMFISIDGEGGATAAVNATVTCYENETCPAPAGALTCQSSGVAGDTTGLPNTMNVYSIVLAEYPGPDAVYSFTSPTAQRVTINTSMGSSFLRPRLFVIEEVDGACKPANTIARWTPTSPLPNPIPVTFDAEAGKTYYFVVDGRGASDFGTFTISVSCVAACAANEVNCPTGCAELSSDPFNCGGCGNDCAALLPNVATATCSANACAIATCDAGFGDCDADTANGCETDTQTSFDHCGSCNQPCQAGQVCQNGMCVSGCTPPLVDCGGSCVDTQTDLAHCGGCDQPCAREHAAESCVNGVCTLGTCDAGFGNCDQNATNGCEQTLNTLQHCGLCNQACTPTHGTGNCDSGTCVVVSCEAGYEDCNHQAADGCEALLASDPANCGACGTACSFDHATAKCENSACAIDYCDQFFGDCDNDPANGCETPLSSKNNCGQCGVQCTRIENCIKQGLNYRCSSTCSDTDQDTYAAATCGGDDCDDSDASINPAATETCNGKDDNCNGAIDEGFDQDADGYTTCATPADCNDTDPGVYPGAPEICGDGVDQDCSGSDLTCSCPDADFDGEDDKACGGTDCNDGNARINAHALEICDGIDNNCDGVIDIATVDNKTIDVCDKEVEQGCGCASTGSGSPWTVLLLLGLGWMLRRRG
jgi:uncharacterized protein (TIGR03382 family)